MSPSISSGSGTGSAPASGVSWPSRKRDVFVLYELEELDGETIAELLDCKVETVRTRLHYARKEFARLARRAGLGPEGTE